MVIRKYFVYLLKKTQRSGFVKLKKMENLKYQLQTVEFGNFGVESAGQAYVLLTKLFPEIANKELAKQHIFRICKAHDENIAFDLFDNKRSFSIGGFGAPTYISISKI